MTIPMLGDVGIPFTFIPLSSAFPVSFMIGVGGQPRAMMAGGLMKREYLAAAALTGLCARNLPNRTEEFEPYRTPEGLRLVADLAKQIADATMAALEEKADAPEQNGDSKLG